MPTPMNMPTPTTSPPTGPFTTPASRALLKRVAEAMGARGIDGRVAADAEEAKALVLDLVPAGTEVHSGSSVTLEASGIRAELETSGRYDPVRPRMMALDRATQAAEIRRLRAAPEVFVNSANAVTEDGQLVWASRSGTQLGPIAAGAARVIVVVGAQKIVPDLDAAFERIERHVLPLEDARAREAYGRGSAIHTRLVMSADAPGRTTVILVAEPLGF